MEDVEDSVIMFREEEEDDNFHTKTSIMDIGFPPEYVNMQHPDDYTIQDTPIIPSFVVIQRQGHARLMFRISWKTGSKFMPMSFIVETGAIKPVYFSKAAIALMEAHGLLLTEDFDNDVVELHKPDGSSKKVSYRATPKAYGPINLIGLQFITRFGLTVEGTSFRFHQDFAYF